jgi:hypothetical protein
MSQIKVLTGALIFVSLLLGVWSKFGFARDTVNLPAVASAFDGLMPTAFVGVGVPPRNNGRPIAVRYRFSGRITLYFFDMRLASFGLATWNVDTQSSVPLRLALMVAASDPPKITSS